MNKKLNILLFTLIAAVLTFAYLTLHHYRLMFGLTGASLCQISQTINCDSAALSSYSEFMGIPIALFGLFFSAILFLTFLFIRLEWLEPSELITKTLKVLLSVSALLSLALGFVSIFKLGVICPFCFLSYLLILISCGLTFNIYKGSIFNFPFSDLSTHKGFLISLAMIPFLAWVSSANIQSAYGYDEIIKIVPEKIALWKQMPTQSFDVNVGLIKGEISSSNTLIEFADFKCPHCKSASETLKNFAKSKPSIKIIFKPFPLDGNCNPHVSFKGDGSRCQMAGLVLCSEKLLQKGWIVHDYFFENQEKFSQTVNINPVFKDLSANINIKPEEIDAVIKCSESSETFDLIRTLSNEAKAASVEGTPTLFMNNRKLNHGQFLKILNAAYQTLDSSIK
jgi:uncharacterized membrane protein/protein-disulfide isomerase